MTALGAMPRQEQCSFLWAACSCLLQCLPVERETDSPVCEITCGSAARHPKAVAAAAGLQATSRNVCDLLTTCTSACGSTGLHANPAAIMAHMQETWDIVCVLLMIRITHHHQLVMNKRRIPCLDDYFDRVNLMLWPRFKVLALLGGWLCGVKAVVMLQDGRAAICHVTAAGCLTTCRSCQARCC